MKDDDIRVLLAEKHKRLKLEEYRHDFPSFASDQIKIITKDAIKGFVPFTLNECQKRITIALDRQLAETGKVRAIILKARQQGISTYCAGRVFWKSYFTPHARSVVMAHDSATSDALFMMSKNLISNMSGDLTPEQRKSNAKEIIINSPAMGDRDAVASYRLYTAGSPEAGRGTTPTIAHLSEVAFWQYDAKILAGLFQGISQSAGTEVILESTANGAQGEFYRLWKGAVAGENEYVPIFLPWYITEEYRRKAPTFMQLSTEEEELREKHALDKDQLYWRRLKIAEGGKLKFRQEYPITAEEAFIVSGSNVFDIEKLNKLKPFDPHKRVLWDQSSKLLEDHREGDIKVFAYPKWEEPYVIGADVAMGVGLDYCAAVVMDNKHRVVATYRNNRIDPSLFGELLFYLGRYYNNAFLAVESNSIGIATLQQLDKMRYVNLYKQTKIANLLNEEGERLGFRTTSSTKPAVIGNLKGLIEEESVLLPDADLIQELKEYVATETGRTEAAPGCHDDMVMSLAICAEVLRTHWDRLSTDNVSWRAKVNSLVPDNTNWF